jgi:hypothetical protein
MVRTRLFLSHVVALALLAVVPASVAIGHPPPSEPIPPGISASSAL